MGLDLAADRRGRPRPAAARRRAWASTPSSCRWRTPATSPSRSLRDALAETGLTPCVVGRDGTRARPGGRVLRGRHPGLPACLHRLRRRASAPTSVCGPFYASTGRVWRMDADQRDDGVRRRAHAPRARGRPRPVSQRRTPRHRAAQPLRDLPGQHRRPGPHRPRPAARRRASGWPSTPTTSTSRSAPAPTRSGPRVRTWCTSRSAAATGVPRAATRPTGRRWWPRSTRWATAAPSSSRASPPTTPPSPPPPRSGARWPPPRTTWPVTAWRSCGPFSTQETSMSTASGTARPRPLGVAVIGYAFMGKAHSHAWRNVGALRPGAPAVRQQVLVGRDADAVAAAADAVRLGRVGHRLARGARARRHRHRGRLRPRPPPRRGRDRRARGGQARASPRSRWPTPSPRPRRWSPPHGPPASAACTRWSASTTAACRRSRWPAGTSPRVASATCARCASPTSRTGWPTRTRR